MESSIKHIRPKRIKVFCIKYPNKELKFLIINRSDQYSKQKEASWSVQSPLWITLLLKIRRIGKMKPTELTNISKGALCYHLKSSLEPSVMRPIAKHTLPKKWPFSSIRKTKHTHLKPKKWKIKR